MADIRIPEEIVTWMNSLNWGEHHDEYHAVKRWDIWYYLAAQGDPDAQDTVTYIEKKRWKRAKYQEGEPGDGLEFLAMHRAMIILINEKFPQHKSLFEGWKTPPTDPQDINDPVANGEDFDADKLAGIDLIENNHSFFQSEDHFGIFVETTIQPLPNNPNNRRTDKRYGNHNYLHNRWTDSDSPINLGDPKVNIFNKRFWNLHGWIDKVWTNFRKKSGLNDNDVDYKKSINYYLHMMNGHHHHMMNERLHEEATIGLDLERPKLLKNFFNNE